LFKPLLFLYTSPQLDGPYFDELNGVTFSTSCF